MINMHSFRRSMNSRRHNISRSKMNTLLDKAQEFRTNHEDLLEADDQRSIGMLEENEFDVDSFLEDYYDTMKEIREQEKQFKQSRPSSLHLKLKFTSAKRKSKYEEKIKQEEDVETEPSKYRSVITKSTGSFSCCRSAETLTTNMTIDIYDAVQLNKMLASDLPKLKHCKVKCFVMIGKPTQKEVVNTDYGYCNENGSTAWYHQVVIKGFSIKELKESCVALELIGSNGQWKIPIAKLVLAGKPDPDLKPSTSTSSLKLRTEYSEWKNALNDPGTEFSIITHIKHCSSEGFGKSLTSLLVKEASLYKSDQLDLIGLKKIQKFCIICQKFCFHHKQ